MGSGKEDRSKLLVTVKVDNLLYSVTSEMLRGHFERYGEVGEAYIMLDALTNQSRGFGYVR